MDKQRIEQIGKYQLSVWQCVGEGQGSCKRCSDNGKWNRMWMPFLYKIDGLDGCYCWDCVKELDNQKDVAFVIQASVVHARWVKSMRKEFLHDYGPDYKYVQDGYHCSNCNHQEMFKTNYCSTCGAKMDEV